MTVDAYPWSERYAWVMGRFGVSWQVVPEVLAAWLMSPEVAARERTFAALLSSGGGGDRDRLGRGGGARPDRPAGCSADAHRGGRRDAGGLALRCTLAVVSNTHHPPLVHGLLRRVGLAGAFAAVVTSVEHGRRQPCRAIYEHALALTGGAPGEALFVGDSLGPDYVGPRAVGMRALLIDPEGRAPVLAAHRLASVLELRERIGA